MGGGGAGAQTAALPVTCSACVSGVLSPAPRAAPTADKGKSSRHRFLTEGEEAHQATQADSPSSRPRPPPAPRFTAGVGRPQFTHGHWGLVPEPCLLNELAT